MAYQSVVMCCAYHQVVHAPCAHTRLRDCFVSYCVVDLFAFEN